jgi:MSHA biogenesis protein MshJ
MSALLKRYAARFDDAPLRQRVLMFVALALVIAFLAEVALVGPLRERHRRLGAEITLKQKEAVSLGAALQSLTDRTRVHPDIGLRERQAALQGELAQVNARVLQEGQRFTPPDQMRGALEGMLRSNPRLALLEMRTLPAVALGEPGAASGAAAKPALYRHGMELTVAGTYLDFYEYLRTLEKLPTQLYWGKAELAVGQHPGATLKLTVYTVSFDSAWLVV